MKKGDIIMKKRLLLTTLVAIMVASTLFVGCSSKEDGKGNNTIPTNSSSTKVEEGDKNIIRATLESETKEEDDKGNYSEKYLDEPNWEKKYKEEAIPKYKRMYDIKKFVFEDMTQKFKNKEEFNPVEGIHIWENDGSLSTENFVCDVVNIIPEDSDRYIWFRDAYKEFAGFNVDTVEIQLLKDDNPNIVVKLEANDIKYQDSYKSPMWVTVTLNQNEDGTFFYKNASFGYEFYEYLLN